MNIYIVDAGELSEAVYEDYSVGAGHWEYFQAIELIAAPTRGTAKSEFLKVYDNLEITEIKSVRLIARDVDYVRGRVWDDERLWLYASCLTNDYDEAVEWANWQAIYDCGFVEEFSHET